jgi:hypothetical protein
LRNFANASKSWLLRMEIFSHKAMPIRNYRTLYYYIKYYRIILNIIELLFFTF